MTSRLDYRWNLRQVMANRQMFQATDLIEPLAQHGIGLSSSQVYRLVGERPERLSLKVLMALLDILDCSMENLIEPIAVARPVRKAKAAGGAEAGVGDLRPPDVVSRVAGGRAKRRRLAQTLLDRPAVLARRAPANDNDRPETVGGPDQP